MSEEGVHGEGRRESRRERRRAGRGHCHRGGGQDAGRGGAADGATWVEKRRKQALKVPVGSERRTPARAITEAEETGLGDAIGAGRGREQTLTPCRELTERDTGRHKVGGGPDRAGVSLNRESFSRIPRASHALSLAPSTHVTAHMHPGPLALLASALVHVVWKAVTLSAGARGKCCECTVTTTSASQLGSETSVS